MAEPEGRDEEEKEPKQEKRAVKDFPDDENENSKKWTETCIGIWSRSTQANGHDAGEGTQMVCTGINIVRIGKDIDPSKVEPSKTRGVQVTVTETGGHYDTAKDEDVGTDGMIGYRPPLQNRNRHGSRDNSVNQPTPLENLVNYYSERKDRVANRMNRYREDPAQVTEIWYELIAGSKKQYQTAKRLISYCKPKEKMNEMYRFAREHMKSAQSWLDSDKKGKS